MIDLCALCICVIYNPAIPTRTVNGTVWNDLQFGDGEKIMNGTLRIEYTIGDGYIRLPLKAITTINNSRYCGMHADHVAKHTRLY